MVPALLFGPGSFEFLLMGVWLVVPALLAYWMFADGRERGEDAAAWWAVAVGGLGYLTFFGGLLAAVVYVRQRDEERVRRTTTS